MFDEKRFQRLIDAYFDLQLQVEEKRELESMLLGSSRAREIFLEHAEMHGLTREWALRENSMGLLDEATPADRREAIPLSRWLAIGAGIAACIAISFVVFQSRETKPEKGFVRQITTPAREEVALLGQAIGVVWEQDSSNYTAGSALPKGWLKLKEGTLRLDFYSGARVYLQGPASLELISQDLARLDHGKLVANVPPPAEGFTVLSSDLRVVDRGTEFGMNVSSPGDCEVHVFDGEVELHGAPSEEAFRSLYQGDALAIREGKATPLAADRGSFTDPAAVFKAAALATQTSLQSWSDSSQSFRSTPDLLVYFDFEDLEPGRPFVSNKATGAKSGTSGSIIGCDTLTGRWPGKAALGFAKTSDRIRFRASGTTSSLTMMAWIRVDSLPLEHNALLSMSPDTVGEVHWKLDNSGRMLVGLRALPSFAFESWERLESPSFINEQTFGQWVHVATVIDNQSRTMKHFVNGNKVASGSIHRPTPVRLGMANVGNFDAAFPARPEVGAVRNFNGRIDEFALIGRALKEDEIRAACGAGKGD